MALRGISAVLGRTLAQTVVSKRNKRHFPDNFKNMDLHILFMGLSGNHSKTVEERQCDEAEYKQQTSISTVEVTVQCGESLTSLRWLCGGVNVCMLGCTVHP